MSRIGVGVIGLGGNGLAHCERYLKNPKCELVAVCDIDENRLKYAVEKFGVKGYKDYEILKDSNIQAISINTPDCIHKEPFIKALETGHHVIVEKPMADTLEDVKAMVDAYRKHKDKVVMVAHVLRFLRYFSTVKKWIDSGALGDIFYVEADYIHDLRHQLYMEDWKITKESPMLGGGCHPLDILRWYVGDAVEVSAMSNHISYPEMYEDATIIATFKFSNGAIGKVTTLYGCTNPRPFGFNLSVYGTKGSIVRDKLCLDSSRLVYAGEKWAEQHWLDLPNEWDDQHHDFAYEINHFLTCIEKNQKPLITPEDSANTIIAGLYAIKACKENKVMTIPGI